MALGVPILKHFRVVLFMVPSWLTVQEVAILFLRNVNA